MIKCIPIEGSPGFSSNGGDVSLVQDEGSATVTTPNVIVRCHSVLASRFGYPNDEALPGDPLYDVGLEYYGVVEVLESPWLLELNRRNRIVFPESSDSQARHFYMAFHDSSFEVLCDKITFHPNPGYDFSFPLVPIHLGTRVRG